VKLLEYRYVQFESLQEDESRAKLADSLKAYRETRTFVCPNNNTSISTLELDW